MTNKRSKYKYPEVYLSDVVGFLFKGVRGGSRHFFFTVFSVAIASSIMIFTPIYYKNFFDILSSGIEKSLLVPALIKIIYSISALYGVAWLFWRVAQFSDVRFRANSMMALRQQAYNNMLYHSFSFFSNNFTGALVQRVGRYARAFERLADRFLWEIIPLTVCLSGMVIVTYFIDPRISFIIVIWAILYMVASYLYSSWRLKFNIMMAEADSHTTAVLADAITNQNNIEVFGRYEDEIKNFGNVTKNQRDITVRNWDVNSGLDAIQSFFSIAIEFAVFYFAIMFWQNDLVTIGSFVLIQLYILGLSRDLWDLARVFRDFYEAYADAKEMVEIMKLPYEIKDVPGALPVKVHQGQIVFEKVGYSYNQTREVIKDINLTINAGEKVALVGPSGAGKTTLARLILRFYDVSTGKILIDGQDIHRVKVDSLRNSISLVPQDPLLFHRTIMENIRYGKPTASDDEVKEAAKLAHCDEFIDELPHKYETYVGERGIKLSGGERQRVAIARAILKNAPILVLDEATSSLDSHSESLIQDALNTLMEGKTVIVIAHRLSTIRKMDRLIIINNGEVIEEGTHDELISKEKSLYKKLWTLQVGGFIK